MTGRRPGRRAQATRAAADRPNRSRRCEQRRVGTAWGGWRRTPSYAAIKTSRARISGTRGSAGRPAEANDLALERRLQLDGATGMGRGDLLPIADIQGHVGDGAVAEDQITGLQLGS